MAANDQYDVLLGAPGNPKGYMLVRARSGAARAWKRYGVRVSPQGSSPDEARFNSAPDEIRFAETWDDFSGGFGYAYRTAAPANGIHWSENMDTRFQGQAVHCQALLKATLYDPFDGGEVGGVEWVYDLPMTAPSPPIGFGGVFAFGRRQNIVGDADSFINWPKSNVFPPALDTAYRTTTTRNGLAGPAAIFGSYLYVGGASGPGYRFDLDGLNGTRLSEPFSGFANAGNVLWAKVTSRFAGPGTPGPFSYQLRSLAAGADATTGANWSATLPVGNGQRAIKDMVALDRQLFLGLSDGLYAGDSSGSFFNVTGDLSQQANEDNFRDLCVHDAQVVGQHISGIFAYDPNNTNVARVRQIGPTQKSNRSPVQGFDTAIESYGGWLYAARWTGSQTWLMAGREGQNGYHWNLLNRVPVPGRVSRIHFDGISYGSGLPAVGVPNRMWVAMEGSAAYGGMLGATAPLYFQPIPPQNNNPLSGAPYFSANYNGSARMVLPRSDRGAPGVLKMYEYAEVWADAFLSGSRYADVYYQIDGGARTLLGRAQSSPVSTLYFTQSNPSFYSGRSIELDVESYDATPGTCQAYRSLVVYGVMRPNQAAVIDAVFHVGDSVPDRRGVPMRPGRVMIDELRSYADPTRLGGQALTLIDLAGATQNVVVVGEPVESEFYQDGSRDPEIQVAVKLAVLTGSGA